MSHYYTSISISELQNWLADEALQILSNRIIYSVRALESASYDSALHTLLNRLPAFSLDDHAGTLIVEISNPATWGIADDPVIDIIKLENVKQFIPLTTNAKISLSVNWKSIINLSDPVFELAFLKYRLHKKEKSSIDSASRFVKIFISHSDTTEIIPDFFLKGLARALLVADSNNNNEIEKILPNSPTSLLCHLFKYTRHEPLHNESPPLRSFYDVGLLFKEAQAYEDVRNNLRAICIRLTTEYKKTKNHTLEPAYSTQDIHDLNIKIYPNGNDESALSIITASLFLRWKQAFHDQQKSVPALDIYNDIKALSCCVPMDLIVYSLWLLGAYLGSEYVSSIYRLVNKNNYPAMSLNQNIDIKPLQAWIFPQIEIKSLDKSIPSSNSHSELDVNTPENSIKTKENNHIESQKETEISNNTDNNSNIKNINTHLINSASDASIKSKARSDPNSAQTTIFDDSQCDSENKPEFHQSNKKGKASDISKKKESSSKKRAINKSKDLPDRNS